jgi:hypothetical protein
MSCSAACSIRPASLKLATTWGSTSQAGVKDFARQIDQAQRDVQLQVDVGEANLRRIISTSARLYLTNSEH